MEFFQRLRELTFRRKVGLALGGGATRGQAHIGVLKVFEEEGIPVDYLSGTSVGSIIGALYASGYSWKEMHDLSKEVRWGDLLSLYLPRKGLFKPDKLEDFLNDLIGGKQFEDLDIPFSVVTVDLNTGEEVHLSSGPVARAVRASCSVPGIFIPTRIDDRYLIDGGVLNSVPAEVVANMGADFVIAVNLNADRGPEGNPRNLFDILFYTFQILIRNNMQRAMSKADVIIAPDLKGFSYQDMKRLEELIERGEAAAREALPLIETGIGWKKRGVYVR